MNNILRWAKLDNSDSIFIEAKSGYYTIQDDSLTTPPIDVMSFASFKNDVTYNIADEEQVYDSIVDAALDTGGDTGRNGDYTGLRIASSYFKSGDITEISYITQGEVRESNKDAIRKNILAIAIYKNGVYTVKAHCTKAGDPEPLDKSLVENGELIPDSKNLKTIRWILSNSVTLDKDFLGDSMAGFFIFSPDSLEEYPIGTTFTHEEMRTKERVFNLVRILCMHRGLSDSVSFSYEKGGASSSPDYIPFLSYKITTNNVEDHITDNFKKYHLDNDSVSDISYLKYSAPFIQSVKKINNINAIWNEIFISDISLKGITHSDSMRVGKFDLKGFKISKIQIPFNFTYAWYDNDYMGYYLKGLEDSQNNDYGILYLPMYLELSFTGPDTIDRKWYRSLNALAQNYPKNPRNYGQAANTLVDYEFNFEGVEAEYEGNGIWIRVYNGERLNYSSNEDGSPGQDTPNRLLINDLGISYHQAATSDTDYIVLRKCLVDDNDNIVWETNNVNVTAPVKIYFDYNLRSKWNELVDNHIYENELIKYNLFNTKDDTDLKEAESRGDKINKFLLSGKYSPSTTSLSENYYLYTLTIMAENGGSHSINDNTPMYLAIYDHGTGKITYSINSLILNNSNLTPTWLFDVDDFSKRLELTGSNLTISISPNNTETNIDNIGKNIGAGLRVETTAVTDNDSKIYGNESQSWVDSRVPTVIFGFKHDKIKDLEERLNNIEIALSKL